MVHSHVGKYACGSSKSKYIFKSRTSGDWRDDPTVKNTNCYSKEPEFNSYHQYGCSHLSVILVSEVLIPSNRHIFKQNIYAHKNKLLKHKNRLWRYESMIRTIVSLFFPNSATFTIVLYRKSLSGYIVYQALKLQTSYLRLGNALPAKENRICQREWCFTFCSI